MRTALVTGGAKGIGAAVVRKLCSEGFSVAINYLNSEEKALALSSALVCEGFDAFAVRADVTDPAEVKKLVSSVISRNGRLDALVNNAGVDYWGPFDAMTDEDILRVARADFLAPQLLCREVIPHMVRRRSGRIINISSVWGQEGASCEAAYSAAKAGVIGLTKALAKELAPSGVTVNCVAPGAVDTDMMKRFSAEEIVALCGEIPAGRLALPEEIACAVAFFAGEGSAYITGQTLGVNGGMA